MYRRTLLALVAGVAGCSGSQSASTPTSTPTPAPTVTATPTATAEPASFELVEVDAPGRVEIGADWSFAFLVRNAGGQDATFRTRLSVRSDGGAWQQRDEPLELEIPAGETRTWESQPIAFDYLGDVDFRLEEFDETFGVTIVAKTLDWGRPYTTPADVGLILTGVDITDSFEWSTNGRDYVEEAPSGSAWGLLGVRAENNAGVATHAPRASRFFLVQDNTQYNAQIISTYPEQYQGGELQAGVVARGDIVFELDAGTTQDDLVGVYSSGTYAGDVAVYWGDDA